MDKIAHVIGNGPSWEQFKKITPDDFVIGCNATKCKEADVTIVSDMRMCNQIIHMKKWNRMGEFQDVPIVASERVNDWYINTPEAHGYVEIYDVFTKETWFKTHGMSSAHSAAFWAISKGYTEIHVWGIDAYWDGLTYSYTDKIVPSLPKKDVTKVNSMADWWKRNWDYIIEHYPNINIILHKPLQD